MGTATLNAKRIVRSSVYIHCCMLFSLRGVGGIYIIQDETDKRYIYL